MNGYVTAEEMAERWNVSVRQVQLLCQNGKIDSVKKFGNAWAIPEDTTKPTRTGKLKPGRKQKQHMPRKTWTPQEIDELEQRIRDKVKRKAKLTFGEDVIWGVIRSGRTLNVHFVEEVDFMAGIDFGDDDSPI